MKNLVKELQQSGVNMDQIKQILTIISKRTNTDYSVMGTLVENILRRNHLIEYP